ncbi:MAG TPA: RsiV family protein [Anaerolineales bacterium]
MKLRIVYPLILLNLVLISACTFWPLIRGSAPDSPNAGNTPDTPGGNLATPADQSGSPTLQATHAVNLPLLANAGQQEGDWQLVPQESESVDEDRNLRIQVTAPEMQDASEDVASTFNQAVEQIVQSELEVGEALGGEPIQDPGGFLLLGYQVTSSTSWEAFEPYAMAEDNPGTLAAGQAALDGGHRVIGLVFEIVSYFGGAHPISYHRELNYDLTAARVLSLEDLFEPGSDYLDVIAGYSIDELSKNREILFEDFEQYAAPAPENYSVWTITPGGLLIVFEEYQVAPYAAGPQYVVVPYSALAGTLDPAGPLGKLAQ